MIYFLDISNNLKLLFLLRRLRLSSCALLHTVRSLAMERGSQRWMFLLIKHRTQFECQPMISSRGERLYKASSHCATNEQRVKIKIHIEQILKIRVMNGKNSEFANLVLSLSFLYRLAGADSPLTIKLMNSNWIIVRTGPSAFGWRW